MKLIARVDGVIGDAMAKKYWYHTDHLGSVKAVTNNLGLPVWKADYLPFGQQHVKEKIDPTFEEDDLGFTGKGFDQDIGLYYFNARWYDAETGRFISEDPVGDPNNPNLYTYCRNNPLRYIDPTGLWSGESNPLGPDGGWGSGWNTGGSGGSGSSSGGSDNPGSSGSPTSGPFGGGLQDQTLNFDPNFGWNNPALDTNYNPDLAPLDGHGDPSIKAIHHYRFPIFGDPIRVGDNPPIIPIIGYKEVYVIDYYAPDEGPSTPEGPDPGGAPPSSPPAGNEENNNKNQYWGLLATAAVSASQKALEDKAKSIDPIRYISYNDKLVMWENYTPKYLRFASYSIGGIYEAYSLMQIAADNRLTLGQKIMKGVIDVTFFAIEVGIGSFIATATIGTGPAAIVMGYGAALGVSIVLDLGKNALYDQLGWN